MKIFIDSADIEEIKDVAAMGLVDGVTTNPTLIARSGRSLEAVIEDMSTSSTVPSALRSSPRTTKASYRRVRSSPRCILTSW